MKRRNLISLVLLVIYLAAVAWCCFGHFDSLPNVGRQVLGIPTDKVVHFIMFFPFPILSFLTFYRSGRKHSAGRILLLTLCVFLFGVLIAAATEVGQSYTTYRSGDSMDFLADTTALAAASLMTAVIFIAINKKQQR